MKRSARQAGFSQGGRAGNRKRKTIVRAPKKPALYYGPRRRNIRTGGLLGVERKYVQFGGFNYDILQGNTVVTGGVLNLIAQGDDADNRNGARIVMRSVQVEGYVYVPVQANATATDSATVVYVALVLDTQTNGAALTPANVWSNPSGDNSTVSIQVRNIEHSRRYKVLQQVRLDFDTPTMSFDGTNIEVGSRVKHFSFFKNLEIPVQYSLSTAAIGAIVDNSIHLVASASEITTSDPKLYWNSMIRFTDV